MFAYIDSHSNWHGGDFLWLDSEEITLVVVTDGIAQNKQIFMTY